MKSRSYRIDGLDCADCASKLESTLRKLEGMEDTRINFASGTLRLKPVHLERAQAVIQQVEPGARVEVANDANSGIVDQTDPLLQLVPIGISALIFVSLLLFQERLGLVAPFLPWALAITGWALSGWQVLAGSVRNIRRLDFMDEQFLMTIATIGAFVLVKLPEAVGVMLFFSVGEFLQDRAVNKSRHSIRALLDLRPETVQLRQADGAVRKVALDQVVPGDRLELRPGERLGVDGRVESGEAWMDCSAMNGESTARRVQSGDVVEAGWLNTNGFLVVTCDKPASESAASRIMELVESAHERKAPTEKFIRAFARWYTPAVVIGAVLTAVVPPLAGLGSFSDWLYRALIFLVVSCPCALMVSVPLGYFAGIGAASARGLLVKGAESLDKLAKARTVVFDKTGTLTKGQLSIAKIHVHDDSFTEAQLLALVAQVESRSNHPLALAIQRSAAIAKPAPAGGTLTDWQEMAGRGISCQYDGAAVLVGKRELLQSAGVVIPDLPSSNDTQVHVAHRGQYSGRLDIADQLRPEALAVVQSLQRYGVEHLEILSGDHEQAVRTVADSLGVADWKANLRPEGKLLHVEDLLGRNRSGPLVFVGDGINDAPVLARADLGIAMGGLGSDAAIEAADAVIMHDDLRALPAGIAVARKTRRIVWQNIIFALSVKALVLALGGFGLADLWEAIIADVGVALVAVLNSVRLVRYINVNSAASPHPADSVPESA